MAAVAASAEPLLPPGERQQYSHMFYGWLLARACTVAGTDLQSAWSSMVDSALGPGREAAFSLVAPSVVSRPAEPCGHIRSPSIQEFSEAMQDFSYFIGVIEQSQRPDASAAEKADGAFWKSIFGKESWIGPTALRREVAKAASELPGLQAFATARTVAEAMRAAAKGRMLRPATLTNALRSRRPGSGLASTPCRMVRALKTFEGGEWGLGIQLSPLKASGAAAGSWGHAAANGSFALVLPNGRRPLAAVFLTNRSESGHAAKSVLEALAAATRGSA